MFRRLFTTAARFLCRSNSKPLSPKPHMPPRPSNDPKLPNKDTPSMNIRRFLKRSFNPRSRHFLYTFAKPKLSAEERSKDLFFATLATVIAWELEPWIMPWGGGNLFASEGERMFDYIVYAVNDDRRD